MNIDLSEVGEIYYEWDFNEDEYREWLNDNEDENGNPYQHSQERLMEYIEDGNVEFTLEFTDNDIHQTMDREYYDYNSLSNEFEERMVNEILQDCIKNGKGEIEMILYYDEDIDVNNPSEVNRKAHQLFKPSSYYKGLRGFILTDGTIIETPAEHNECTRIPNVKGTYHFITLGNIRLLQNSIDIGQLPTPQQERVLYQVIGQHENDTLYVDVITKKRDYGWQELDPDPRQVLNKIKQYIINGIKPLNENKNIMKNKTIMKITEKQLKKVIKESVQKILNEGTTNTDAINKWGQIIEMVGAEQMLSEMLNFLSSDDIDSFIKHMDRYYELGLFSDEEEEYDEY